MHIDKGGGAVKKSTATLLKAIFPSLYASIYSTQGSRMMSPPGFQI